MSGYRFYVFMFSHDMPNISIFFSAAPLSQLIVSKNAGIYRFKKLFCAKIHLKMWNKFYDASKKFTFPLG